MIWKALCSGLTLIAVAGIATAHPHVVRKIQFPLQSGQMEVQYFTVPFNPKHLESVPPGFFWHLGFATIGLKGPLTVGKETVAKGKYHLFARESEDKSWSLVLIPEGTGNTIANTGREILTEKDKEKQAELIKSMEGMAQGLIVLPTKFTKGGTPVEHLRITVEDEGTNYGELQQPGKTDKPLGHDFILHVDFGDLHGAVALTEGPSPPPAK